MLFNYNHKLVNNSKLYLAFSCGADSIACSHFLKNFYRNKNVSITLLHVNHNFIPFDKDIENKAKYFAEYFKFNIEIHQNELQYNENSSSEAFCHDVRMNIFKKLNGTIIVCHHLNDAVESYLMNCLSGFPERATIPVKSSLPFGEIVRPFLLTQKQRIDEYVADNKLDGFIAHDPLNNDMTRRRNWTRNVLIPVIEEKYKGLRKVVAKKVMQAYNDMEP